MRKMIQNPKIGAVVICAAILLAVVITLSSGEDPQMVTEAWFYDLEKKELFKANAKSRPPIAAPSGQMIDGQPAGVQAWVYGCGGCDKPFIAFLDTFKQIEGQEVHMVRLPDADQWFNEESPEGREIMGSALKKCGKVRPHPCRP